MKFKALTLPEGAEGAGLDFLTIEIPHEAKRMLLDRIENNIAAFGMTTDYDTETFGGDPSGVALKWLYIPLDLKAGMLERKLVDVLYEVMWFVNKFFELSNEKPLKDEELLNFQFTFNKFTIVNEKERVDMVVASSPNTVLSEKTALANHPWVDDVDAEIKQIEEEEPEEEEPPIEPEPTNGIVPEPAEA